MQTTRHLTQALALLGGVAAMLTVGSVAAAEPASTQVFVLTPSTHGNPEGVAFDARSNSFFVGATGDGTIYRGALGNTGVQEFIPGAAGKSAIGLKVARDRLYVAGGATGNLTVYDLRS